MSNEQDEKRAADIKADYDRVIYHLTSPRGSRPRLPEKRPGPEGGKVKYTDKQRLDWLGEDVYRSLGLIDAKTAMVTDRTKDYKLLNFRGRTVRQALDRAIRSSQKRKDGR